MSPPKRLRRLPLRGRHQQPGKAGSAVALASSDARMDMKD